MKWHQGKSLEFQALVLVDTDLNLGIESVVLMSERKVFISKGLTLPKMPR